MDVLEQVKQLLEINEKLTDLHWISAQIATEQDVNTLYNLIINGFSDIIGIPKCAFYLVNEDYDFKEVTNRIKDNNEPFWLCQGTELALKQALKERLDVIPLGQQYCGCCQENCSKIKLHVCALYDRSGKPTGLLVAYESGTDSAKEELLKILELFTIQVSLALENAVLTAKLRDLAIRDGLTGLYNHRYFMESLDKEILRCAIQKNSLTLLMIDVDDFKQYNDTFGHPAGDYVLQMVASIMTKIISKAGTVFRYGGEEFAIILPGSYLPNSFEMAERIRHNIANYEFKNKKITISIGIAEFPKHALGAAELLQIADKGLYIAKGKGKNTVCYI
jgi:diguanylate cyclase (GGDEF)-like protein